MIQHSTFFLHHEQLLKTGVLYAGRGEHESGPLGVLGSGVALILMTTLVGRVGASRGSVSIYFVPVVAILLGVGLLGERLTTSAIAGAALVLLGAWLTSRPEKVPGRMVANESRSIDH